MQPIIEKKSNIENLISAGKLSDALIEIRDYVERVMTEPVCVGQVFGSSDLDGLCVKIGTINLANLPTLEDKVIFEDSQLETVCYLVSKLQRTGGHSRLVQDFIRAQPLKNHIVISTEIGGPSDKRYYEEVIKNIGNLSIKYVPNGNLLEKLSWIQSLLLKVRPKHTYLFNHHQDSVAVSAIVPDLCMDASFCHHGDHHLCLGVSMDHLTHIDFHPMGYHYCRDQLGLNNVYVPLTFDDKSRFLKFENNERLITATAAEFNKLEIPYYVNYLKIIPKILKETDGKHLHIGRLTPWGLHTLYAEMRRLGVPKERFIYVEWTPSVWKKLQEFNVDVYVVSFPYGAGLTLIEAMGAGVPVIMHQHFYSRVLSSLELAYSGAFVWATVDELIDHLKGLTPKQILLESNMARLQYENYHRSDILNQYLNSSKKLRIDVPPLSKNFKPRLDEWAAWVDDQFKFSNIVFRYFYRLARKIRRFSF